MEENLSVFVVVRDQFGDVHSEGPFDSLNRDEILIEAKGICRRFGIDDAEVEYGWTMSTDAGAARLLPVSRETHWSGKLDARGLS